MIQIPAHYLCDLERVFKFHCLSVLIFKMKIIIVIMMMISIISKGGCKDYVFVKCLVHATCSLAKCNKPNAYQLMNGYTNGASPCHGTLFCAKKG